MVSASFRKDWQKERLSIFLWAGFFEIEVSGILAVILRPRDHFLVETTVMMEQSRKIDKLQFFKPQGTKAF